MSEQGGVDRASKGQTHYLEKELYCKMQEGPEFFDFLQNGSLDGIWYWDLEKPKNEWISPRFWDVLGYSSDAKPHLAQARQDVIHPDDLKMAADSFDAHHADASLPYDQLLRYRHANGSIVWVRCRGIIIRDAQGKPIRMLGAHTEVTSLKEMEEKFTIQQELLEACQEVGEQVLSSIDREQILDSLTEQVVDVGIFRSLMVALVDDDEETVTVVRSVVNKVVDGIITYGQGQISRDEEIGLCYALSDDNITAEVARTGRMQVIGGADERFDKRVKKQNPNQRTVSYFIPVKKEERVLAVLATGSNVEDSESMLERIKMMTPLFNQVAIALEHAALYEDLNQSRLALHRTLRREEAVGRARDLMVALRGEPGAFSKFLNFCKKELLGLGIPIHSLSIELPGETPDCFCAYHMDNVPELRELRAGGMHLSLDDYPWVREAWMQKKVVEVSTSQLSDLPGLSDVAGLVELPLARGGSMGVNSKEPSAFQGEARQTLQAFARIIDDGLHHFWDFADLKQAHSELAEQTDLLMHSNKELEEFAYVASHDLQEPLRMVSSYLQLLQRRYEGKLDEKADRFIAYAVDGATRMKKLINALLGYSRVGSKGGPFAIVDCAEVLNQVLKTLSLAIQDGQAKVTFDKLPEVMGDAVQFGQLFQNLIGNAVKFRREDLLLIHVGAEKTDDAWVFSVKDNGIGIEKEYSERIFSIFQRLHTKDEYEGTGIGLAVCKKIVDRHGGRIWLESELDKGTTFYFSIPVKLTADQQLNKASV